MVLSQYWCLWLQLLLLWHSFNIYNLFAWKMELNMKLYLVAWVLHSFSEAEYHFAVMIQIYYIMSEIHIIKLPIFTLKKGITIKFTKWCTSVTKISIEHRRNIPKPTKQNMRLTTIAKGNKVCRENAKTRDNTYYGSFHLKGSKKGWASNGHLSSRLLDMKVAMAWTAWSSAASWFDPIDCRCFFAILNEWSPPSITCKAVTEFIFFLTTSNNSSGQRPSLLPYTNNNSMLYAVTVRESMSSTKKEWISIQC